MKAVILVLFLSLSWQRVIATVHAVKDPSSSSAAAAAEVSQRRRRYRSHATVGGRPRKEASFVDKSDDKSALTLSARKQTQKVVVATTTSLGGACAAALGLVALWTTDNNGVDMMSPTMPPLLAWVQIHLELVKKAAFFFLTIAILTILMPWFRDAIVDAITAQTHMTQLDINPLLAAMHKKYNRRSKLPKTKERTQSSLIDESYVSSPESMPQKLTNGLPSKLKKRPPPPKEAPLPLPPLVNKRVVKNNLFR
jgi:hypothetical protein